MPDNATTPYIPRAPGDLLTAEDWNDVQTMTRADMAAQLAATVDEIIHGRVDHAGDAERFATMTPDAWTALLDERYAPKHHDHEGTVGYRRYVKHFDSEVSKVLLNHNLGRFPLVDIYELLPVVGPDAEAPDLNACKVLFFNGHADADRYDLRVRAYGERALRGIIFARWLAELGVVYTDDSSISDVVNDMWDAFMKDPNDEIPDGHCQTGWIADCCERNRTVGELKRAGEWDDLFIALRPRKCGLGGGPRCRVLVEQVNYDVLYLEVAKPDGDNETIDPLDLMVLLRI